MKEILFQQAFKKAKQQSGSTTKNGLATHLEQVFEEGLDFRVNKITFSRYYEQFIENNRDHKTNPKTDLLNKLAEYLCYENYEDFIKKNEINHKINPPNDNDIGTVILNYFKRYWLYILIVFVLLSIFAIMEFNEQRWMVWKETEYIEVDFDLNKYELGQLKLYKEERIKNFKRIEVDCQTAYKKPDGTPKIWYGKNQKKELQYFTSLGLHPETGTYLKPLSKHMFDKYVCPKDTINSNKN